MIIFLDENITLASAKILDKRGNIDISKTTNAIISDLNKKGVTNVYGVIPCKSIPEFDKKYNITEKKEEQEFFESAHGEDLVNAVQKKAEYCARLPEKEQVPCVKRRILDIKRKRIGMCSIPPPSSRDEDIVSWCNKHNAVLVTEDKGYMLPPPAKIIVNLEKCRKLTLTSFDKMHNITLEEKRHKCVVDTVYDALKNVRDSLP